MWWDYYVPVHPLAQKVLEYIRREELLHAGDRVGVAVSGGADSVALLRLLLELRSEVGIVLSVVHLNHKLRGKDSDADEQFVRTFAHARGLEFHSEIADVAEFAAEEHFSLEAAARKLRYDFFQQLLASSAGSEIGLDKIATGHTLDDQAETVLLRVIRGTGMRGLRAIQPRIAVEDDADQMSGEVVRPLLGVRRHMLEQYLGSLGQPWREDATNADPKFTRNRVRHVLLPLLETEFNPAVTETLADLAEIARQEEDYWEGEVAGWMGTAVQFSLPTWLPGKEGADSLIQIAPAVPGIQQSEVDRKLAEPGSAPLNASISLGWLLSEPVAVQRRVIKAVSDNLDLPLEFRHIEEIVRFANESDGTGKRLTLPLGWLVQRDRESLLFVTPDLTVEERIPDYQYSLTVPGRAIVPEIYASLEAVRVPAGERASFDADQLFDPELLGKELRVRNWRPGDRFWPAHTKAPKKLKELLQEKHIPQTRRRSWPVVLSADEIVWVVGFPGPAQYRPPDGKDAVLIRAVPLDSPSTS